MASVARVRFRLAPSQPSGMASLTGFWASAADGSNRQSIASCGRSMCGSFVNDDSASERQPMRRKEFVDERQQPRRLLARDPGNLLVLADGDVAIDAALLELRSPRVVDVVVDER